MKSEIGFLRRRHWSLKGAVDNLERNLNAFEDCGLNVSELDEIFDRIDECLSEVRAIRVVISDKMSELEVRCE
jgi:hypothetical protein